MVVSPWCAVAKKLNRLSPTYSQITSRYFAASSVGVTWSIMEAYKRDVQSALSPTALSRTRHRRAFDPFRVVSPPKRREEVATESARYGTATLGPSDVELLRQLRKEAQSMSNRQRSSSGRREHSTVREAFHANSHLSSRAVHHARDAILGAGSPSKHHHAISPGPRAKVAEKKRGRNLVRHTAREGDAPDATLGITAEGIERVRRFRDRHPYLTYSPEYSPCTVKRSRRRVAKRLC